MMVMVMVTVELGMVTGAGEEMDVSVELGASSQRWWCGGVV